MTRPQTLDRIMVEEYEDGCRHEKIMWVLPSLGAVDCEGGSISVRCASCKEPLGEVVAYE